MLVTPPGRSHLSRKKEVISPLFGNPLPHLFPLTGFLQHGLGVVYRRYMGEGTLPFG